MDTSVLRSERAERVDGEVRFDPGTRAVYAQDASNYRQVPIAVVVPRAVDAALAAIAVCRDHDVPVLSRGGGTSLAGQCCNEAVVIDWTKYCRRLHDSTLIGAAGALPAVGPAETCRAIRRGES